MSDAKWLPEVDPNPAEPRMVIWSTLRCLELQIDQHEELYDSHGVVSWELLKHMVRLAKRHAHEEGGKAEAAERETDQWRTRADEANATLRETEQELQRLRQVHLESQSEELQAARSEIVKLRKQQDQTQAENAGFTENHRLLQNFAKSVRQTCQMEVTDHQFVQLVASALHQYDALYSMLLSQNTSFAATELTNSQTTPNSRSAPVTEPFDDSSGADVPGQS